MGHVPLCSPLAHCTASGWRSQRSQAVQSGGYILQWPCPAPAWLQLRPQRGLAASAGAAPFPGRGSAGPGASSPTWAHKGEDRFRLCPVSGRWGLGGSSPPAPGVTVRPHLLQIYRRSRPPAASPRPLGGVQPQLRPLPRGARGRPHRAGGGEQVRSAGRSPSRAAGRGRFITFAGRARGGAPDRGAQGYRPSSQPRRAPQSGLPRLRQSEPGGGEDRPGPGGVPARPGR